MVLAHVALPARGTSCRASHAVADAVFLRHRAYVLETLVGDDVVAEHVDILLDDRLHVGNELLHVLHEVGVDVVLQSTYSIIVLNQASARGLLHAVQHMLAVAHGIEERRECAHILGTAAHVEQVRVNTLQLVHDGADVLDAVGKLHA